ncbi:MAG TPA: protein phosphatase 2C domain-containing protein [Verrucomicrobiae bacterium]|nr:protein phosphatase 2C domain-containing protein [Verrucomicrobiae bacterium]
MPGVPAPGDSHRSIDMPAAPSAAPPASAMFGEELAAEGGQDVRLRLATLSVVGPVRETNEDHVGWFDAAGHDLTGTPDESTRTAALAGPAVGLMVADGLGGHGRGDLASRTATRIVVEALAVVPQPGPGQLRAALELANGALLAGELDGATDRRPGPQTTAAVLVFAAGSLHVAHIGDTRVYRMRDDVVELLTRDHSQAAELVRMKVIKPYQARTHPGRHLLTRSLGGDLILRADAASRAIYPGDAYAVCTDGCWGGLDQEHFEAALRAEPAAGARDLVSQAIASGGDDNATVAIIHVDAAGSPRDGDGPDRPFWRRLLAGRS